VVLRPRDDRVFYANQIRIFDYSKRAEPLRDAIRENMEGIDRERNRDRVRTEQEKFPEGAKGRMEARQGARRAQPLNGVILEWTTPPVFFNGRDFPSADNVGRG